MAIGTIGGGSVVAIQAPSLQLGDGTTAAILSAPNGVVGVRTDTLSLGAAGEGTIAAGTGVLEISGITRTVIALGNVNSAGTLGLDFTGLDITAGTLRLGSFDGTTVATAIEIDGSGDLHTQFGTLDLRASGSVTQSDSLIVGTLIGNAGSVVLDSAANNVGTLGAFGAANGFTLVDGTSLSVAGLVSGGTGSVVLNTGSSGLGITSGGRVTGAAIGLTAGSIDIGGSLDTPGTLTLAASQGAINEGTAGFVGALGLTGSAADVVTLFGSSNAVGTIAGFSAVHGFTLTNGASLTATDVIDAHSGSVVINNGTFGLALNGTVTAMAAAFSAGSIDLNGSLGVAGLAMLTASRGAINEAAGGFLNAGTLAGSAHTVASLLGTNAVGTLGDFSADSLLLNAGTAGLTIAGVVTAGHTVDIAAGGLVTLTGSIIPVTGSTLAISLSGDTLTLSGLISDGGSGTTGLFATNGGTITETGSLIVGTLTGSASVADFSAGSNTIAALANFTAGTLLLDDTSGLTVSGVVTVGTTIAIIDTGFDRRLRLHPPDFREHDRSRTDGGQPDDHRPCQRWWIGVDDVLGQWRNDRRTGDGDHHRRHAGWHGCGRHAAGYVQRDRRTERLLHQFDPGRRRYRCAAAGRHHRRRHAGLDLRRDAERSGTGDRHQRHPRGHAGHAEPDGHDRCERRSRPERIGGR